MEGEKLSDYQKNGGNRDISLFGYVKISIRLFLRPISGQLHAHACSTCEENAYLQCKHLIGVRLHREILTITQGNPYILHREISTKKNVWACNFRNSAPIFLIFSRRTSDRCKFFIFEGISQKDFRGYKLDHII